MKGMMKYNAKLILSLVLHVEIKTDKEEEDIK